MPKQHNLQSEIEKVMKEFRGFMVEEYGKWKIGRVEAESFLQKSLISIAEKTAKQKNKKQWFGESLQDPAKSL